MKQLSVVILAVVALSWAMPARAADVFTIEVSPGVAGADGLDSFGIGGAATIFILPTDVVSLGLRPEFDWQKRSSGHDFFFSANAQADLSVSDTIVPSVWVGIGVKHHTHNGLDLNTFLAAGGMVTEGTLGLITSGTLGNDGSGVAYNFGGQVKFKLTDHFYLGPQFSFLRGDAGDVKKNHYRVALSVGLAF